MDIQDIAVAVIGVAVGYYAMRHWFLAAKPA